MKCPDCGAEMIPGFNSMTFYCPNECDLKAKQKKEKKAITGKDIIITIGELSLSGADVTVISSGDASTTTLDDSVIPIQYVYDDEATPEAYMHHMWCPSCQNIVKSTVKVILCPACGCQMIVNP